MKNFKDYIVEMTGAIYDGSPNGKDFQWEGKPKPLKKKSNEHIRKNAQSSKVRSS